jgi:single-strand DNA-binding protein
MMFDTIVTIIGNVLNTPEWRKTTNTGSTVVSFKVASTARRMNRETRLWEDGNSLRVRVNCWRRLAEGVGTSVRVGDPVIVVGRLYTRDWQDDAGTHRLAYELEAIAVGHDLSKGRSKFSRVKAAASTSMVDDAEADGRVGGEPSVPLHPDEMSGGTIGDIDGYQTDPEWADLSLDAISALRGVGIESTRLDGSDPEEPVLAPRGSGSDGSGDSEPSEPDSPDPDSPYEPGESGDPGPHEAEPAEEPGRRRRRRVPVPA